VLQNADKLPLTDSAPY